MNGLHSAVSLSLIKKYWYCALAVILVVSFATTQIPYISQKIQSYAISSTQDSFGARPLAQTQEQKIRDIAQKLGVTQSINIRKMGVQALQQYGYQNAFAYFPQLFNLIPIGDQAFMYISEGFFEDLSEQEQDFLIGHELVHIKHSHTKYIPIFYLVVCILIAFGIWWMRRKYLFVRYWIATLALWIGFMWITNLGHLFYRRIIEREADMHSLECLGTHKGLLEIVERWKKEFHMPLYNNYYGLFSDHPSISERKAYCLESQQNHKGS